VFTQRFGRHAVVHERPVGQEIAGDEADEPVNLAEADAVEGILDRTDPDAAAVHDAVADANEARGQRDVAFDQAGDLVETDVDIMKQFTQPREHLGRSRKGAAI